MFEPPPALRTALDEALAGIPTAHLTRAVEDLIDRYRSGGEAHTAILDAKKLPAYAAYRMPATYAAARSAFEEVAARLGGAFAPRSHLDIGGGTGAAVWAAADAWPSIGKATVLERVAEAAVLGQRLAARADSPAVRGVAYRTALVGQDADLPAADLATASYLLGELSEERQAGLVAELAERAPEGGAVVLVEPGTPAGYRRILNARQILVDAGLGIAAPCPHGGACPLAEGDWCHFSARVTRSALHRRIKGGTLGHEDEKFGYVAAVKGALPPGTAPSRVLRHPARRKGLVELRLCRPDGTAGPEAVSKRQGDRYRAAKDAEWGGSWPPEG